MLYGESGGISNLNSLSLVKQLRLWFQKSMLFQVHVDEPLFYSHHKSVLIFMFDLRQKSSH